MKLSGHNIVSKIHDSEDYIIVNPLYNSADIISESELVNLTDVNDPDGVFVNNGYLTDDDKEKKAFKLAYLNFTEKRDSDEVQLFFVPNYSCNFACSYCYQEGYDPIQKPVSKEVIDAFFEYVYKKFAGRKKYITVFGGEPLLPGESQKQMISYLLDKAVSADLDVAFVTNGFTLKSYVELFKKASIREVQVTLDGTEAIHDGRRYLKGKKPTFNTIVEGIDVCLEAGININLRMVIDKDNIDNLPLMAQFAIEKGWTRSGKFKTQIGRNYELHVCNSTPEKLFDRASLYRKIYDLLIEHPYISDFYKPAFSIARYISENEELPEPLFDSCPGCKTEWAFDYTGTIYSCTATVGKKGEELGKFYPEVSLNEDIIEEWQNRDITTIEKCKTCQVALACGGGCASVAKNKNGKINSPDCRPVKELLSLGAAYYFKK